MENRKVLVTLSLENQLSFIHTSHQNNHASFEDILETLTVEECREIILKSVQSTDIKPIAIEALVKKVIDAFDLYVLLPGIDAPQSEYDTESHRIAENIAYGMSLMDIATVIKDVFDYYFDAHYSVSVYMEPANQIHTYLNHIHQNKPKTKGVVYMIHRAIQFATACHQNQTRKGTDIPYILHCLEAGSIAASLTNEDGRVDTDVVAAAILHDTIEDAYVTYHTLKEAFNENIADLVRYQSEDKSKPWAERKQDTINLLQKNMSKSLEIATLSDKLSNMRSIYKEYRVKNDHLWEKFNAGKELQHWYYSTIADSLYQIRDTDEYKEYKELIKKTFGNLY